MGFFKFVETQDSLIYLLKILITKDLKILTLFKKLFLLDVSYKYISKQVSSLNISLFFFMYFASMQSLPTIFH